MSVHEYRYKIGDVGILFRSRSEVPISRYVSQSTSIDADADIYFCSEAVRNEFYYHNGTLTWIGEFSTFGFVKYNFFLADQMSDKYHMVHGSGFEAGGVGILAIGGSGAGKSTVPRMFPDSRVLSDDMLMLHDSVMCMPVKQNMQTFEENGMKRVHFERKTVDDIPLGAVLLLDRTRTGGFVQETSRTSIPRTWSLNDRLPPHFHDYYLSLRDIPVACRIYEIGTGGNEEGTRKAVEGVIDGVLHD